LAPEEHYGENTSDNQQLGFWSGGGEMKRIILAGLVLIQGCSLFTPPKAKPVIEERSSNWGWPAQKVGVMATTPERRVVVFKWPENLFCAEPPADAADNVSTSLTAIAEAAAKGKITDVQLGIASNLATTVKQLFQRSQGVQLYRDGTFMLCIAFLNGLISGTELLTAQEKLLERVVPLVEREIPELHKRTFDTSVIPVPTNAEVTISSKPVPEKAAAADKGVKNP
jgi:hypothetical protein